MLNEIAEFESYVKDPASRNPRIQPKLFTENFSNSCSLYELDQILLVIARGFIFSAYRNKDFWDSNGILNQEILTNTTTVLMRWCGFVPQNTNNFSHPDNPPQVVSRLSRCRWLVGTLLEISLSQTGM